MHGAKLSKEKHVVNCACAYSMVHVGGVQKWVRFQPMKPAYTRICTSGQTNRQTLAEVTCVERN